MKNDTYIKNNFFNLTLVFLVLSLVSCGSSQSAYNDDGIYVTDQKKEVVMVKDNKSEFYEDYFAAESERYELDEEDIFTDIDEYGYEDADTLYVDNEYIEGGAPWNYATNVSVSFHMGFGGYYGYYPWHGYGYGYGYYNPWYWGPRYGYGGGYWGWGYCPPYYPGYYPPYYGHSTYGKRDSYGNRYSNSSMSVRNVANNDPYDYKRGYSTSNRRTSTRNYSDVSRDASYSGKRIRSNSSRIANNENNKSARYSRNSNLRTSASTYRPGSGEIRRNSVSQYRRPNSASRDNQYIINNSSRNSSSQRASSSNTTRYQSSADNKTSKTTQSSQRRATYSPSKTSSYARSQRSTASRTSRTTPQKYSTSSNYNKSSSSPSSTYSKSSSSGSRSSGARSSYSSPSRSSSATSGSSGSSGRSSSGGSRSSSSSSGGRR